MQIGEVIRNHRKKIGITQEEMANRLGVSTPAVNKWENGNSMPDIMLLAPIARLLDITPDILLSFQEELTDDEVNSLIREADERLKKETYAEVFAWAKKQMQRYPNCETLTFRMALVLDARRCFNEVPDSETYDDDITKWYTRALCSGSENVRETAADSLFGFYVRKEQYEKAEEYLQYFSGQNPERKRKQAVVYSKTNRMREAYQAYEELLFSGYQMMSVVLHSIYMLKMQENDREKAHMLVEKQKQLAQVFDMGEYHGISAELELAVVERNADKTIAIAEKMLASIKEIGAFRKSSLYEHMAFQPLREEFLTNLKQNLLENFRDEETFGFLVDDKRWKKLIQPPQST